MPKYNLVLLSDNAKKTYFIDFVLFLFIMIALLIYHDVTKKYC